MNPNRSCLVSFCDFRDWFVRWNSEPDSFVMHWTKTIMSVWLSAALFAAFEHCPADVRSIAAPFNDHIFFEFWFLSSILPTINLACYTRSCLIVTWFAQLDNISGICDQVLSSEFHTSCLADDVMYFCISFKRTYPTNSSHLYPISFDQFTTSFNMQGSRRLSNQVV